MTRWRGHRKRPAGPGSEGGRVVSRRDGWAPLAGSTRRGGGVVGRPAVPTRPAPPLAQGAQYVRGPEAPSVLFDSGLLPGPEPHAVPCWTLPPSPAAASLTRPPATRARPAPGPSPLVASLLPRPSPAAASRLPWPPLCAPAPRPLCLRPHLRAPRARPRPRPCGPSPRHAQTPLPRPAQEGTPPPLSPAPGYTGRVWPRPLFSPAPPASPCPGRALPRFVAPVARSLARRRGPGGPAPARSPTPDLRPHPQTRRRTRAPQGAPQRRIATQARSPLPGGVQKGGGGGIVGLNPGPFTSCASTLPGRAPGATPSPARSLSLSPRGESYVVAPKEEEWEERDDREWRRQRFFFPLPPTSFLPTPARPLRGGEDPTRRTQGSDLGVLPPRAPSEGHGVRT